MDIGLFASGAVKGNAKHSNGHCTEMAPGEAERRLKIGVYLTVFSILHVDVIKKGEFSGKEHGLGLPVAAS